MASSAPMNAYPLGPPLARPLRNRDTQSTVSLIEGVRARPVLRIGSGAQEGPSLSYLRDVADFAGRFAFRRGCTEQTRGCSSALRGQSRS
jgi:hypothetical protein